MRKLLLLLFVSILSLAANASVLVTSKYIDNPNFEARFAGWHNSGFYYVINNSFGEKNGQVYMERWVSAGSKVPDVEISQNLVGLPNGTYTLVAGCQNVQQSDGSTCTGASLYAGSESVEVNASKQYSVVFTVVQGKATIGFKVKGSTGNWASIDNVRLYYDGIVADSIQIEMQKLIDEAEGLKKDETDTSALDAAIEGARGAFSASSSSAIGEAAKALSDAMIDYRELTATGNTPSAEMNPFIAAGATIALARTTVNNNRTSVKEKGVCWSTSPEPTIKDDHTSFYFANAGELYVMEHLEPATIYYVRAYAMSSKGHVGYSDAVKFATLPKGTVTGSYNNGGSSDENKRINSALNEIKWLYNNLSGIHGLDLNVNYGAQTPTADCSFGGYMRVGPSEGYQQTGTLLHETNHGVGVGTTDIWWNGTYRAEGDRGLWLGPRANQMVQFLNNDANVRITGDNTHMWPTYTINSMNYGLNGAFEDIYNPENTLLYYGNVFITHALHQDGLHASGEMNFASPAYVFMQDDNTKYYLKNESENCGVNTSYLTVNAAGALCLAPASSAEIRANENFAWTIAFNPATGMYNFRNVGTGRFLTKNSSGYTTVETAAASDAEGIQLLPARSEFSVGGITTTTFWMVKDSKSLAGVSETSVGSAGFSHVNSASAQRWLILTDDKVEALDSYVTDLNMTKLNALLTNIRKSLSTPYKSKDESVTTEEAGAAINGLVEEVTRDKANYGVGQIIDAMSNLRSTFYEFLGNIVPESAARPMEITWLMANPEFDNGDESGWSQTPTSHNNCGEFYETSVNMTQTITPALPAGTYQVRVNAFQRPGRASEVYDNYVAGTSSIKAYLSVTGAKTVYLKNIFDDALDEKLQGATLTFGGKYIPDNMEAAESWFNAGYYLNTSTTVFTEPTEMKIGIVGRKTDTQYWTIFDHFRLLYYGNYTEEDIAAGVEAVSVVPAADAIYDLQGRRLNEIPAKGIYIVGGKKVVKF